MKSILVLCLLMGSTLAMAKNVCDLKANDQAVDAFNAAFDRTEMRGEDHAIGLKDLYTERLVTITACLTNDQTLGITYGEMKDVLVQMQDDLNEYVIDMNDAIQHSIDHDRIGMATELAMERDLHMLETKNLMAKIKKMIKK